MAKPKQNAPKQNNPSGSLAEAEKSASTVTPEVLQQFWHDAQIRAHAFEFRIKASEAIGDIERVHRLQEDAEYVRFKKRRDYFANELAAKFPDFQPALVPLAQVEQQIIVADYLDALRLQRDSQIASRAAQALGEDTERKMALQEHTRALKYIQYFKAKYEKLAKQSAKNK